MDPELDAIDHRIITLLQQDGRMPNVEIARRIGMSEATIRKRVDRLISSGVIRVTALPDLARVGLETVTVIGLRVELDKIDAVGEALRQMEEVRWVGYVTGECDILFEAAFTTDDELLRFLTNRLAALPGIRVSSTTHVLRMLKDIHEWRLPQPPPPLVLIVDDDPDFVEIMGTVLKSEGFEIISAANGDEALEAMRRQPPDLVILDVMMSGILDGVDASKRMRLDKMLRRVPILMVSSITGSDYAAMFPTDEYIPVDNFISKPVAPEKLLAEVKRLLRKTK